MIENYDIVIGLEIHAELSTKTKIYCGCRNEFGLEVNTVCCPICLGMPGALPSLNKTVVDYAIKMGYALNCSINSVSKQDRKNYYYPDLPKAYQITQDEVPLCYDGYVDISVGGIQKRIGVTRIHIEEDAGKLIHDESFSGTLVDFNRCGVPLIEIVSEPDMRSSKEAKSYLETIKIILSYMGISDCKMQEGSLRCDVNVSVMKKGSTEYGIRCEMKNISTFSGAVKGIEYEARRQVDILESGGTIIQQTRRWDDDKGQNFLLREKKNADDYRYFREPDIGKIVITEKKLLDIKDSIPELPNKKVLRYIKDFKLSEKDATLIVESLDRSFLFESVLNIGDVNPKLISNWILGDILGYLNEKSILLDQTKITPRKLFDLINAIESNIISSSSGKVILIDIFETDKTVDEIILERSLKQNSDIDDLKNVVVNILKVNEKSVIDYNNGKTNALGFVIGQCMKETKGKGNPAVLKELVLKLIKKD